MLVSEHYNASLMDGLPTLDVSQLISVCHQLSLAVSSLHQQNIVVGRLSLEQVLISKHQVISYYFIVLHCNLYVYRIHS